MRCPECKKDYEPDFPERREGAEPYQNEQHKVGYCSDKCFDEAISGHRPEYMYDEKGRRFENGVRKLFADPPEDKNVIYCNGRGCKHVFKEGDRAFEVTVGQIMEDPELGTFFDASETTYHLCDKCGDDPIPGSLEIPE